MRRWLTLAAFVLVAGVLLLAGAQMRPFGAPRAFDMDRHFILRSQEEVAANNVVTAIVFDYRGYDTLGEATVLFTAVLGVALILRRLKR
jgi:multisubunit Na+/H+ antiporter MnhB subunit